jgi:hypothetical protein
MKYNVLRTNLIWFGIWLTFFFAILIIGSWQKDLYWRDNLARFNQLELFTVRSVLPYAVAYLEDEQRPDLLQRIINTEFGPYFLVITDKTGHIKYAPEFLPAREIDLTQAEGFNLYKSPSGLAARTGPAANHQESAVATAGGDAPEILGKLYLVPKANYSLLETLDQAYNKIVNPSESVLAFTLLSYIMVLVGFAGICAISAKYQNHFQEIREKQYETELEARELRIQVLESNIKSSDLRMQLLDRRYEQAHTVLDAAKNTIAGLEMAIQYESNRNEELQGGLRQAEAEREEALQIMRSIEQDREAIAAELTELEVLREVEEMNYPVPAKERTKRPKEFLWLNLVYKNLHFSRRALQNIIDLQYSHDIFPSLPDALANLNNSSVESLMNGGALPSRSVVKYSQPLQYHTGDFWEYRFSKDGRLFFGLSQSKTWNIDTILLKRKFTENRYKYEKYLQQTLGKDNDDIYTCPINQGIETSA